MGVNRASVARQNEATRHAIIDAAFELFVQGRGNSLSFLEVSERAGVSERTVFRHFPSQQALYEALAPLASERLDHVQPPDDFDGLSGYVRGLYAVCDANSSLVHALLHTDAGRMVLRPEREERLKRLLALLRRAAPHADDLSIRRAAATVRYLASGGGWDFFRHQAELSLEEATRAAIDAITPVVTSLVTAAPRGRKGTSRGKVR